MKSQFVVPNILSIAKMLVLAASAAAAQCSILPASAAFAAAPDASSTFEFVKQRAQQLSQRNFVEAEAIEQEKLPKTYDDYRKIVFDPERARWRSSAEGFEVHLLPLGWLFKHGVKVWLVENGEIRSVDATTADFIDGKNPEKPALATPAPMPLSGFRINWPLNAPGKSDEVIVFQGASYFRALARGQRYGLSARALAIGTASPGGEEFPEFREFWIEKPARGARSINIYSLLDSPSTSGAYRFVVHPGTTTRVDVEGWIYPRREIAEIGIAPLTSMFMLGPADRDRVSDFRPQVHDSDGLAILNGKGERLWRPLANPQSLQVSAFVDNNNKGFGLIQRERSFSRYEDLEARYDLRPSAWVEPLSEFGKGSVALVEIPTEKEIHDNIVSFWRPADPIPAGHPYSFRYRLHWRKDAPTKELGAYVVSTRAGDAHFAKGEGTKLLFVIDYKFGANRAGEKLPGAKVNTSQGRVQNVVLRENSETGGLRVSFEFFPEGAKSTELRLDLVGLPDRAAESWLYRWTSTP